MQTSVVHRDPLVLLPMLHFPWGHTGWLTRLHGAGFDARVVDPPGFGAAADATSGFGLDTAIKSVAEAAGDRQTFIVGYALAGALAAAVAADVAVAGLCGCLIGGYSPAGMPHDRMLAVRQPRGNRGWFQDRTPLNPRAVRQLAQDLSERDLVGSRPLAYGKHVVVGDHDDTWDIYHRIQSHSGELSAAGWTIHTVPGYGHNELAASDKMIDLVIKLLD